MDLKMKSRGELFGEKGGGWRERLKEGRYYLAGISLSSMD
jgi:hypothetical protein